LKPLPLVERFMKKWVLLMAEFFTGDRVKIRDNRFIETHITPRWAYGYCGIVIRSNKLSYTVALDQTDWKVRVNEEDLMLIERKVIENG